MTYAMVRRTVLAALQLLSLRSVVIVRAAHSTAHVISSAYNPVPPQLALRNVVVIHRHGDRSQISREIGPAYPEDPKVEAIWTAAMPTHDTLYAMGGAAAPPDEFLQSGSKDVKDAVYTGWDRQNTPYGQLTDLGAQQLMTIGAELRRRYVGTLLPADAGDAASLLYCRSTNFCRTMQSLRALLAGLLNVGASAFPPAPGARLPTILSRPKAKETMFPTADGPCPRMTERRADVFPPTLYHAKLPFYPALEAHMKETLGYTDKVSWVTVKVRACVSYCQEGTVPHELTIADVQSQEILTCYEAHGIPFPPGVSDDDADRVTELAGWMWGVLYKDDELNRYAIGRFLRELLDVLDVSVLHKVLLFDLPLNQATPLCAIRITHRAPSPALPRQEPTDHSDMTCQEPAKMMFFSGHDSTLVPVLCALGLYDDTWPPYASYLAIEVAESTAVAGDLFVRVIYNDREMPLPGAPPPSDASLGNVWAPYAYLQDRLQRLALTQDEYVLGCAECAAAGADGSGGAAALAAQQEINEDLKATMASK